VQGQGSWATGQGQGLKEDEEAGRVNMKVVESGGSRG